jgi:membrane protease YdiL (CAAX protease family)
MVGCWCWLAVTGMMNALPGLPPGSVPAMTQVERNRPLPGAMLPVFAGFLAVFAVFQFTAERLGSERGEWGLVIAPLVIATLAVVEVALHRSRLAQIPSTLGLGRPRTLSVAAGVAVSAVLLLVVPLYLANTNATLSAHPAALSLLPGLFAQGGIAEEALFRGYLFGRLRRMLPFWRAAGVATVPFVGAHLYLFTTLPWPVALAAILLSVIISFPLSRLYQLAGYTIWAPAILHFAIQAPPKLVEISGDTLFPLVWIAASGAIPWLIFLVPAADVRRPRR